MSSLFEWSDSYKVGVEEIDTQHKSLFALASRLEGDLDKDQLQEELMNLFRYVREHFKSEEVMMRDSDYPYYEEHRQLHDDLISILNEQAGEVASDLEKLPAFRLFVADWITNHVKNVDQLLGEHLQS